MSHTCHAIGCEKIIPPKMFMCRRHWFLLPKVMRNRIWFTYQKGQEITKQPSLDYLEIARNCIKLIEEKEGKISS